MERLSSPVTYKQLQTVEELNRIFHISPPVVSSLLQIHSHFALNSKWILVHVTSNEAIL